MAQNTIFDSLGRIMNEAAGLADGARREIETMARAQAERMIGDMNLVKRDDFDALRELVQVQGEEIAQLRDELRSLREKA